MNKENSSKSAIKPDLTGSLPLLGSANSESIDNIIAKCRKIIKCDTARISQPTNRMYLIIGFNRNTADDEGQWVKNGEPFNFDYVQESVVASGDTDEELIQSAIEYNRLCGITWEQYFKELGQKHCQ